MRRSPLLLVLAACGGTDRNGDGILEATRAPDQVTQVAPSTPKGAVVGTVLNARSGAPLSDAKVVVAGFETTEVASDASGRFRAEKVSVNSPLSVTISATGFTRAYLRPTVPGATGQFPMSEGVVSVGPISLFPTDATLKFSVVTFNGRTVANPKGVMEVWPAWIDETQGRKDVAGYHVTSAAGQSGDLTFGNLPGLEDVVRAAGSSGRYAVYVSPVDVECDPPVSKCDGVYEYGGTYLSVDALALLTGPAIRNIVLGGANTTNDLKIDATNVRNFLGRSAGRYNLVPRAGSVYALFNQRILPGSVFAEVRNDIGSQVLASSVQVSALGNGLQIKPTAQDGFIEGNKYNVRFTVTTKDATGEITRTFSAPFFGGDPDQPFKTVPEYVRTLDQNDDGNLNPNERVEASFSVAIGNSAFGGWGIPVYFNTDIDIDGKRQSPGELLSGQPFCFTADEPQVFGATSGYTRKFSYVYAPGTAQPLIPSSEVIDVVIAMSEASKCSPGGAPVYTVWGNALTADFPPDRNSPVLKLARIKP